MRRRITMVILTIFIACHLTACVSGGRDADTGKGTDPGWEESITPDHGEDSGKETAAPESFSEESTFAEETAEERTFPEGTPEETAFAEETAEEGSKEASGSTDGSYSRALAKKNQDFNAEDAEILGMTREAREEKAWTVMIYMIGSNLESALGAASADIAEMTDAGLDYDKNNLVLYTGGSTRWQTDIPCDRNCVIDMSLPESERIVAGTDGNADMGARETLGAFVNFCTEYYPAGHYALILWDHGGGPLWGYGSDELFGGDGLLLQEMDLAMRDTVFAGTRNLDLVGFDACLMGSLENMTVWSRYAEVYVGSEEVEPGDGWDYHFLTALNDESGAREIAEAIVDRTAAYYENKKNEYCDPDVTLSAADLKYTNALQNALGRAAVNLQKSIGTGGFSEVASIRSESKSFGLTGKAEEGTLFAYDLVDLGDFSEKLSAVSERDSELLLQGISDLVFYSYSNVGNACGVTLYYPSGNHGQFYEMRAAYDALGLNRQYSEYLNEMSRLWQNAKRRSWILEKPVLSGDEYLLRLSEEQLENTVSVSYSILQKKENGEYVLVLSGCSADPDKEGILHFPRDPELIALETGENTTLWPMLQAERSRKRIIYQSQKTRLLSGGISYFTRLTSEAVSIGVVIQEDPKTKELSIRTIHSVSQDADSSGKETVDVSNYDAIFYYYEQKIPSYRTDGSLLPFDEWNAGTRTGSVLENLEQSFGFSVVRASSLEEELYYLVQLEDENGERYVSELTPLEPENAPGKAEIRTEKGYMEFALYEDHAVLQSYLGTDEEVEVPESVQSLPITEIGNGAFGKLVLFTENSYIPVRRIVLPDTVARIGSAAFNACRELTEIILPKQLLFIGSRAFAGCSALKEITLPDSLKSLSAYAFSESGIRRITLPEGIEYIGRGVFACSAGLEEIALSDGNSFYTVRDGVLYTKDLTEAIACPAAMTGQLVLPSETVKILSDCFSYTELSEIVLPEGLSEIGNYGFYGAKRLTAPVLPDSLLSIGKYAFSAGWVAINLSEAPEEKQTIRIGKNLRYIGQEAFVGFTNRRFETDPENPYFSSRDGALLSKAGDSMIEFAADQLKSYVIPDGVRDFDIAIMEQIGQNNRLDNDYPYEIYVPDSVIRITGSSMFSGDMVFHCSAGSFAEEYATGEGITVSYDTEPVIGKADAATEKGILHFVLTKSHAALYSYDGEDEEIEIPGVISELPVTVIGSGLAPLTNASEGKHPSAIVLPETAEVLSAHVFEGFGALSLNLPDSIRVIGDYALSGCTVPIEALPGNLEDLGAGALGNGCSFTDGLVIPRSVVRIAPGAFSQISVSEFIVEGEPESDFKAIDGMLCSNDGTILIAARMPDEEGHLLIPDGIIYIGTSALMGLPLTEIEIPASVQLISQYAFAWCTELEKVVFSEGIQNIGSYSFMYSGVKELILPGSVSRIGTAAFYGCGGLKKLETSSKLIDSAAFAMCRSLRYVTLLPGVAEIGDQAFYGTSAASVSFPESLYILGERAFSDDAASVRKGKIPELLLGSNVSSVGVNALGGLPASDFAVDPGNAFYDTLDGMLTDKAKKTLIACPAGRKGSAAVPDGITAIAAGAFYSCEKLTDVTVPDSVSVIFPLAFNSYGNENDGSGRKRIVIHCSEGSAAHSFAIENNWPYVIDEKNEE